MMKKIRIVEAFHQSTLLVQAEMEASGDDFFAVHGGTPDFWFPAGGGVCLRDPGLAFRGVLVVSGLPQIDDHALCREVLGEFS